MKDKLAQILTAGIAAQAPGGGGLYKFLEAQVKILDENDARRLNKILRREFPGEAAAGTKDLDKNSTWLLGRLAEHIWNTKVPVAELIASFREGTKRTGYHPAGILRALHDTLDSEMPGWKKIKKWNEKAQVDEEFYQFPGLDEARDIFVAKHGDVVWPITDEDAMAVIRAAEAEAEADAVIRKRISAGMRPLLDVYRAATAEADARVLPFDKAVEDAKDKVRRRGPPEQSSLDFAIAEHHKAKALEAPIYKKANSRYKEQCRRLGDQEELLKPDEEWHGET